MNEELKLCVSQCESAVTEILSLTKPISMNRTWTEEQSFTIGALYTACLRSSGSALVLVDNGRMWDADILMRSVTEGSIKLIFLLCNPEKFEERYQEFSDALFDIEGIKQHRKAERLLQVINDPDADKWMPIREVLLPEGKLKEISDKYPKSLRSSLEFKWGFTGLVAELSKENFPAAELFVMLLHGYSMSSHHLHADYTGVCSSLERDYRENEKRDAVYMAHGARIISDVFWLSYARLYAGYRFSEIDTKPLTQFTERYEDLNTTLGEAVKEWTDIEYS